MLILLVALDYTLVPGIITSGRIGKVRRAFPPGGTTKALTRAAKIVWPSRSGTSKRLAKLS